MINHISDIPHEIFDSYIISYSICDNTYLISILFHMQLDKTQVNAVFILNTIYIFFLIYLDKHNVNKIINDRKQWKN